MVLDLSNFKITQDDFFAQFLCEAYRHAWDLSPDPSTKVGSVLVDPESLRIVCYGANILKHGVQPTHDILYTDKKYANILHAEQNNIGNLPSSWNKPLFMTMPWVPCEPCANAIIEVGVIKRYVAHKSMVDKTGDAIWVESINRGLRKMYDAGIELLMYEGFLNVPALMHGLEWRA